MRKDAMTRIRLRIRARLDEMGMTARELARAVRTDIADGREADAWISGILKGTQGLHLKYFDAVADKLALSPSELVRYDDALLRELTPREMRLLQHYQQWSGDQQDRWLAMLDYFAAAVPDKETATILDRIRALPPRWRAPVMSWLFRVLEGEILPGALAAAGRGDLDVTPAAPAKPRLSHRKKPLHARLRKEGPEPPK